MHITIWIVLAAATALAPLLLFAFAGDRCVTMLRSLPASLRLLLPASFAIPYLLVCGSIHQVRLSCLSIYVFLPIAIAALLALAEKCDPQQRGHLLDFLVLIPLGLTVDLRWFEPAWPHALVALNKLILLNAGIYGFHVMRQLNEVGLDLRLRRADWKIGLRELLFYMPIAISLGLAIGFLHWHGRISHPWQLPFLWIFTFFLIALPEEIFFRGWMQNLLERRVGRIPALVITAILFGLSHFNKRAVHFNWRYVLLASIAGIFYGRAWRSERRIAASSITHACVDTIWGALLR